MKKPKTARKRNKMWKQEQIARTPPGVDAPIIAQSWHLARSPLHALGAINEILRRTTGGGAKKQIFSGRRINTDETTRWALWWLDPFLTATDGFTTRHVQRDHVTEDTVLHHECPDDKPHFWWGSDFNVPKPPPGGNAVWGAARWARMRHPTQATARAAEPLRMSGHTIRNWFKRCADQANGSIKLGEVNNILATWLYLQAQAEAHPIQDRSDLWHAVVNLLKLGKHDMAYRLAADLLSPTSSPDPEASSAPPV